MESLIVGKDELRALIKVQCQALSEATTNGDPRSVLLRLAQRLVELTNAVPQVEK